MTEDAGSGKRIRFVPELWGCLRMPAGQEKIGLVLKVGDEQNISRRKK